MDGVSGFLGGLVAESLGIPQINDVHTFTLELDSQDLWRIRVERQTMGGLEKLACDGKHLSKFCLVGDGIEMAAIRCGVYNRASYDKEAASRMIQSVLP